MIAVVLLLCFSPFLCASAPKQTGSQSKADQFKEVLEATPGLSKKIAHACICKDVNGLVLSKSGGVKNPLFTQYPDFVMPLAAKYVSEKFLAVRTEHDATRRLDTDHKQVLSLLEKMGFINEKQELYQDIIDGLAAGASDPDIIEMMENIYENSDDSSDRE